MDSNSHRLLDSTYQTKVFQTMERNAIKQENINNMIIQRNRGAEADKKNGVQPRLNNKTP